VAAAMTNREPVGPVLIAGYGSIGRRHFRNLRQLGCREFVFFRSGCGRVDDDEIRGFVATKNLTEALRHRPAVAIITNPTSLHVEVALAAAEAGCDLYIEKPLSNELTNVQRLSAIARDRQLVAMIGCQFRFHPLLLNLHGLLQQGALGRIAGAMAEWGEYLPAWHPWEDYRQSYSSRPDLGGGVILTLIHPLDYLYWLFGQWNRVQAVTAKVPSLDTAASEDWSDVIIEFANGVVGTVHVDYLQRPAVHRLRVVGDAGHILWDDHAGALTWTTTDNQATRYSVPSDFERNTMYLEAMRHFLECVTSRRVPRVPLADGVTVLQMALDARQAARPGDVHGSTSLGTV
jgi:predicted dehydrogenase